MNGTNLTEYISMVRNGDKAAFTQIYNDLKTPVYTIILRIVQSVDVAEDVTQDVFVKLFTSPPDSSVRNPRAWIFRMARNLAIDVLRESTRTLTTNLSLIPTVLRALFPELTLKKPWQSCRSRSGK